MLIKTYFFLCNYIFVNLTKNFIYIFNNFLIYYLLCYSKKSVIFQHRVIKNTKIEFVKLEKFIKKKLFDEMYFNMLKLKIKIKLYLVFIFLLIYLLF